MPRPGLLFLLALPLFGACDNVSAPLCIGLSPLHDTRDGVAEVGPLTTGQRLDDVLLFDTTAVEGVAVDSLAVEAVSEPEDDLSEGDCSMTVDCEPSAIAPGDSVACAVEDDATGDDCTFRSTVTITVTAYDDAICTDLIRQARIAVEHEG